jgi:hypothetical protein
MPTAVMQMEKHMHEYLDLLATFGQDEALRAAALAALCSSRMPERQPYRTWEQMLARYPRLIRAMQWVACLSASEAACGLRDYAGARNGQLPADLLRYGGGEAVAHFGGPLQVIQRAIKARHWRQI